MARMQRVHQPQYFLPRISTTSGCSVTPGMPVILNVLVTPQTVLTDFCSHTTNVCQSWRTWRPLIILSRHVRRQVFHVKRLGVKDKVVLEGILVHAEGAITHGI